MRIFLTGANGFIGRSVAANLIAEGHSVRGLVRDGAKAAAVRAVGIEPVIGTLDDSGLLTAEARESEGVINAASSDHRGAVEALVEGLRGTGKPLLHTSCSSIIGDEARGEPSDRIFYDDPPAHPEPDKVARVALDRFVLDAPGVRSAVLCNTMLYGTGLGVEKQSDQVPLLARHARETGVARYIGRGLNRWSNAHIADVAKLYALALNKAAAGTFLYVESGEQALGEVVQPIAIRLGLGTAQSMPVEEAIDLWGYERAVLALSSNSRARSPKAHAALGWDPRRRSVVEWIGTELPTTG